jgi:hypothetical protein
MGEAMGGVKRVPAVPNQDAQCRIGAHFDAIFMILSNKINLVSDWPGFCDGERSHSSLLERAFMSHVPFPMIYDRIAYIDAEGLLTKFGDEAVLEATGRADSARLSGDAKGFCHWRRVEQAVQIIQLDEIIGQVH